MLKGSLFNDYGFYYFDQNKIKKDGSILIFLDNNNLLDEMLTLKVPLKEAVYKYLKQVEQNVILTTSYPEFNETIITDNNIFNEIDTIKLNNGGVDFNSIKFKDLYDYTENKQFKQIIIFTFSPSRQINDEDREYLEKIGQKFSTTVIQTSSYTNYPECITYISNNYNLNLSTFYEDIIMSGILFENLTGVQNTVLENGKILGSDKGLIENNRSLIIKSPDKIEEVYIDGVKKQITFDALDLNQVCETLYNYLLTPNSVSDKIEVYNSLKQIVTSLNKLSDVVATVEKGVGNYVKTIYRLLSEFSDIVKEETFEIKDISKKSQTYQKFFEYAKKSKIVGGKKRAMNEKIMRGSNILEQIDGIKDIVESDNFTNYLKTVENDKNASQSREFFMSPLSLSDWYDELEMGSCLGLLVDIKTNSGVKMGYSKNFEFVPTTTFIPVEDYIETVDTYFEKSRINYGNLNSGSIFNGRVIGKGNMMIPLFINRYHWKIANRYLMPMLGIGFCHNPLIATRKHKKFIFSLLVEMVGQTFLNIENMSLKWINTLVALLRTCTEICMEEGYIRGIRRYTREFINNPKNRIFRTVYDYDTIVGQGLSAGNIHSDGVAKLLIRYFIEEIVRFTLNKLNLEVNTEYLEGGSVDQMFDIVDSKINEIENQCSNHITFLRSFFHFNKIMGSLIKKIGSFNKFLKMLDSNNGILPEEMSNYLFDNVKPLITDKNYTFCELYSELGMEDWKNDLAFFCIQGSLYMKNSTKINAIKDGTYINIKDNGFQKLKDRFNIN